MPTRRQFIHSTIGLATWTAAARLDSAVSGQTPARKLTLNLVCGMIGVNARSQAEVNALAHKHGFESVEARADDLMRMSAADVAALREDMQSKRLVWGAGFLPNAARADADTFDEAVKTLPAVAAGLQRSGVTRIGTWVSPASDTHTYLQNFKRHVARVSEIARILDGHGIHLGLEYIGTPTLRRRRRYTFIHSMAEMKELIAEIPSKNVGFILDSWHWHMAGESAKELLSVTNRDVVAVDLNDAPAGIPIDEQIDGQRELPCATGVIDVATFLSSLAKIAYDGPVRAEPFNKLLNALGDDEACAATIAALKTAIARAQV
jgi:sugar phosphate isomerase/epimerase